MTAVVTRARSLARTSVLWDAGGALLTGVLSQVVLVASGILVARLLGPTDRGHLALLVLIPVILVKLGGLGVPSALTYELARSPAAARTLVRSVASFASAQAVGLAAVHTMLLLLLLHGDPDRVRHAAAFTLILVPAGLAQDYGLAILQGLRRFGPFNALRMMPAAVYSAGVVATALVGEDGLLTVVAVWVVANTVIGLGTILLALGPLRSAGDVASSVSLGKMVAFGSKGLLGSASPVETFRLDQAVIGLFLAPAALGYYVAAVAFTNLPRFLAQSLGMVAYPHIARRTYRAEGQRLMWRFFWATAAVTVPVVIGLELVIGWMLPFLFGPDFGQAVPMSRLLIGGALLLGLRRVLTDGARGLGHPTIGTVAEVTSWLVLIPGVAIGASAHGALGVAWAVLASAAISLVIMVVGATMLADRRAAPTPVTGDAPMIREPVQA